MASLIDHVEIEMKKEIENVTKALNDLGFEVVMEDESVPVFDQLMFMLSVLHQVLNQTVQNS